MPFLTLPFHKLCPGGNPTILIRDNALFAPPGDAARRADIARALMDPGHLGAEQVGFLDMSRTLPHLEMMGGEFCVNATRSAALVFALLGLLPRVPGPDARHEGEITTSGVDRPVRVRTVDTGAGTTDAAVAVPLPPLQDARLVREYGPGESLVRLPGIAHLLLDAGARGYPHSPLEAAAAKRAEHALENEEAVGVVWHGPCPGQPETLAILPVVWVAATMSSVLETACGSGSLALALLLASRGQTRPVTIRQPSGEHISITLDDFSENSGSPARAWVSGPVRLAAEGLAHVSL